MLKGTTNPKSKPVARQLSLKSFQPKHGKLRSLTTPRQHGKPKNLAQKLVLQISIFAPAESTNSQLNSFIFVLHVMSTMSVYKPHSTYNSLIHLDLPQVD